MVYVCVWFITQYFCTGIFSDCGGVYRHCRGDILHFCCRIDPALQLVRFTVLCIFNNIKCKGNTVYSVLEEYVYVTCLVHTVYKRDKFVYSGTSE